VDWQALTLAIIAAATAGGSVGAAITAYAGRRKVAADAAGLLSDAALRQIEALEKRADAQAARILVLEDRVCKLWDENLALHAKLATYEGDALVTRQMITRLEDRVEELQAEVTREVDVGQSLAARLRVLGDGRGA
jgi:hypothetical protein